MSKYIWILIWIGLVALLAKLRNLRRAEYVCGKIEARYVPWFAFVVFAPVVWMAGNRGWIADTGLYIWFFRDMPSTLSALPAYAAKITKDTGFYVFSALIKILMGNDHVVYLTILAAIQGIALVIVFRKYSKSFILSVFLFVASTDYIAWMFNGMRQFMAVTIIFLATPLMLKKRYGPLLLVILFAATMHRSALIMIPLVLIAQGEAWNKRTLMFIGASLVAILFVGEFTNLLDTALEETQYKNVVSDYTASNDDGTNPIRVLVYSVPATLAFIGRKSIRRENNALINLCTNMSIISMGLYIISIFTSGIYIGRLPIYVSLYGYILLPWEIEILFARGSRRLVYATLIICYLIFYYYQMNFGYNIF